MVQANSTDDHASEPEKTSGSSKVSKSKSRRVSSSAGNPKSSKPGSSKDDTSLEAATTSMIINEKESKKIRRKRQQEESERPDSTPSDPNAVQAEEWSWLPLVHEEQAGHSAVFSKDGQYFFVPSGSSIKIYAAETLKVVSTLSPLRSLSSPSLSSASPHTDLVTAVLLNPTNPLQLYSASLDGTIKIWDWLEGTLLKTLEFGKPISHMCAHAESPDVVFVAGRNAKVAMKQKHGRSTNSKADCTVAQVSLADLSQKSRKIGKKIAPVTGLSLSADGKFLIAAAATTAHIALTASPEKGWIKFVSPDGIQLTRLACHPSHNYFATGDKSGHIRIWDCLQDESQLTFEKLGVAKTPTTRLLHWHAHEVGALAFTPNGAFLISGGIEAVMVLWNMDTGRRGNVPRVGAPIQGISTVDRPDSGQEILLALADGSFAVYNVTKGRFRAQTGSVKLASSSLHGIEPIVAIEPQRKRLALASFHPASIQIHSPFTSDSVQELEVAPSNRVSHKDKPIFITPTTVTQATFDHTGRWLATLDGRDASLDSSAAWYLKFWELRNTSKGDRYVLNTRIDLPHGYERVVMAEFCKPASGSSKLATAGEDGTVKIWGSRGPLGQESWVNRATLGYRDETPTHLSFSPDGSVLAVAQGSYVTLWDGQTHALLYALSSLPFRRVNTVHFVGTSGRYLVVSGDTKDLVVWDVLRNRALRRVSTPPPTTLNIPETSRKPLVVPIPNSDNFAIAVCHPNQTFVSIHSPQQSDPLRVRSLPFHVLRLAPLPSSPDRFMMAAVSGDGGVSLVGDDLTLLPQREGDVERSLTGKSNLLTRTSLFENVFGRSAFKDLENVDHSPRTDFEASGTDDRFGAAVDLRLLDGPAYLLPPIESLFSSLMEGVLAKPQSAAEQEDVDEETKMEIDLDEPAEENVSPTSLLRPRNVDEAEMSMLVDLFGQHALIAPAPSTTRKGSRLVNGSGPKKPLANGKAQINGMTTSTGTHLPSPSPTPSPVASVPAPKIKAKPKANGVLQASQSTSQKRKVPPAS